MSDKEKYVYVAPRYPLQNLFVIVLVICFGGIVLTAIGQHILDNVSKLEIGTALCSIICFVLALKLRTKTWIKVILLIISLSSFYIFNKLILS